MFRKMRRNSQELSNEKNIEILKNSTLGVLSLYGDEGYLYGVPLSHIYFEGKLYFHCSKVGHKIDAIRKNEKASFTVIFKDNVIGEKITTDYESVIAFGKVRILEDEKDIEKFSYFLGKKYLDNDEFLNKEIQKSLRAMYCLEFEIEYLTGKKSKEYK